MGPCTVVHVVASLRADHGGTSRSVPQLCTTLAEAGWSVRLVTGRSPGEGEQVVPAPAVEMTTVERPRLPVGAAARVLRAALLDRAAGATLLHDHGLWLPSNHVAARVAAQLRLPRMVSPRGMLSTWALDHGRARKRLAWRLYQRRDLGSATLLHATSTIEAEDIRRAGLRQPIAVIPNGVAMPAEVRRARGARRRALFLSRLHPKKGVLELIDAWGSVRPPGWELVVAGPGDAAYASEAAARARRQGLSDEVLFVGAVDDIAKWDLYGSAELFVLPTRSENFGMAIAEALASGVPVLTTREAPWSQLETDGCGWSIPLTADDLSTALRGATAMAPSELAAMGARGRALVERSFSWETVASRMSEVYQWLLGRRGEPPPEVLS
jgi:glycosyltransferase involved in cell wall biosynthesis